MATKNSKPDAVVEIATNKLVDHPANPPQRSTVEACVDLIAAIDEFGQSEPGIVCRMSPGGRFRILSGHRRATACRTLGIRFRAIVSAETDPAEAARSLLLGNMRQDLDPIAKATLLDQIMQPVDAGGAAIEREEAGRLLGLESESGIKGMLRLLQLPASFRELVADGTLPVRDARLFVPFADADLALDRVAGDIRRNAHMQRDWKPADVARNVNRHVRPVDGKTTYDTGFQTGQHPRRFDLTDAITGKLKIVSLPLGPKRKSLDYAQNVTMFDRLNKKAIEQWRKTNVAKATKPKQGRTDSKASKAEADRRLAEYERRWSMMWGRCCLAKQTDEDDTVIEATLPWMMAMIGNESHRWLADVVGGGDRSDDKGLLIACGSSDARDTVDTLWRLVCYPSKSIMPGVGDGMIADGVPSKLPLEGCADSWHWLYATIEIDPRAAWDLACNGHDDAFGQLLQSWLERHTVPQLIQIAEDWKLGIPIASSKKTDVIELIRAGLLGTDVPPPKCLESLVEAKP